MMTIKNEIERRADQVKQKEKRYQASPDIVVKVVCRYRAELYVRLSRRAKLSRLFLAWTDRIELMTNPNASTADAKNKKNQTKFLFTHLGRGISPNQTPEELGIEDRDEILAVELMDLTTDAVSELSRDDGGETDS